MIEIMLPAFVASLVLVAMHSYLGLHIIARQVIFVDLALAQMAALGATSAFIFGISPDSTAGYMLALAFTIVGAAILSLTRTADSRIPHEAIIGILFVVATAAAILVADRAPRGSEHIQQLLAGSLLWVRWPTIGRIALVYAVIGLIQYALRDRFMTISFEPESAFARGWRLKWWDFLFYVTFGMVITLSVPVAGVLIVFTFLVVPTVVAFMFTQNKLHLALISWGVSALAVAAGLVLSYTYDFPTGPVIVVSFAGVLLVAAALKRLLMLTGEKVSPGARGRVAGN